MSIGSILGIILLIFILVGVGIGRKTAEWDKNDADK